MVLARGDAGREPSAVVLASHVATCVTDCAGRFVAPESTGVTRTSYCAPVVRPVIVAVVSEELAVWLHVVHAESVDFLYSTVKSVMPVVSVGKVQLATKRSVWPVETVPGFARVRPLTLNTPVATSALLFPCSPYVRAR